MKILKFLSDWFVPAFFIVIVLTSAISMWIEDIKKKK
jgi:hypothetical protein